MTTVGGELGISKRGVDRRVLAMRAPGGRAGNQSSGGLHQADQVCSVNNMGSVLPVTI